MELIELIKTLGILLIAEQLGVEWWTIFVLGLLATISFFLENGRSKQI